MADENPYLEVVRRRRASAGEVGGTLTVPESTETAPAPPEAAPAEEANPYLEVVRQRKAREDAADARLRFLQETTQGKTLDELVTIQRIADETGLPNVDVGKQLPELRRALEVAQLPTAREWRNANPGLAKLVDSHPDRADVTLKDEKLGWWTKRMRQFGVLAEYAGRLAVELNPGGATPEEMRAGGLEVAEDIEAGRRELPTPPTEKDFQVVHQVPTAVSPLAQATGVSRWAMYGDAYSRARATDDVALKYYDALQAGEAGDAEEEMRLLLEAADMERAQVAQDYNQSTAEQLLLDTTTTVASMAGTLKGAGVGGAIGALGGAALGAFGGPGGVAAGAKIGLGAGIAGGTYASSYQREGGSGLQSFLRVETDDGQRLSRDTARKAALVYAAFSATVESATMGPVLKSLVPGAAAVLSAPKAAFTAALKTQSFRQLVLRLAKGNLLELGEAEAKDLAKEVVEGLAKETTRQVVQRVAKGTAAEVGEEVVQELGSQVVGYGARSVQAGELQTPDVRGAAVEVFGTAGQAAGSMLLLGGGSLGVNLASSAMARAHMDGRQQRSNGTVAAIADAATTPSAQASPEVVADAVADATGATTVQVAPQALATYFQTQGNPQAAAQALLGEDAQERMQTALATGQRLELPVVALMSLGQAAQTLVPEMATASDLHTPREALERAAAQQEATTEAEARALVEKHAAPEAPASQVEMRLDALQDSLGDTQHYTAQEARTQLQLWRDFARTMSTRMDRSVDELFGAFRFSVVEDNGKPALVLQPSVVASFNKEAVTTVSKGEEQLGAVDIAVNEDVRTYRIRLKPGANLSTFLHESGHVFLELLADLSEREGAPQQVKDDFATLLRELGAASRAELGEHHEKFAETVEAYTREGKAPSEGLRHAFDRYRTWLHEVYPALPPVRAHLSEEVRGVLDRMFATDEAIAEGRTAAGYTPTVRTAEEVRMTPEEFASLQASFRDAETAAAHEVETQVAEAQAQEADERWQKERQAEVEAAGREYDARPDVRARRYLTEGVWMAPGEDGTLQEVQLGETVGLERKAALRMLGKKEVPASLRPLVRTKKDSAARTAVHPDVVAELFGFPSGTAMLQSLQAVPRRDEFVAETADARMAEKHATLLQDKVRLREVAQAALHAEGTTQPLLREWAAMRRALPEGAKRPPPLEAVRRAAVLMAESTRVRELEARRALHAEKRASEAAALAWKRGDVAAAVEAKMQQVLNHLLYRELQKAEKEKADFRKALRSAESTNTRKALGQGGPHFRAVVDALTETLAGPGLESTREAQAKADARVETLDAFLEALEAPGLAGLAPAFHTNTVRGLLNKPVPWQSLTLAEMREAAKLLTQVKHLAEDAGRVRMEGEARAVSAVADGIAADVAGKREAAQMPTDVNLRRWWHKMRYLLGYALQALGDPEEQLRHLGPTAHAFFLRGFLKARDAKQKLSKEVGAFFATTWQTLPQALQERRYEVVDTSALPLPATLRQEGPRTRQWAWMVALHMGNEVTRRHLLQGYGWTEKQVLDFLNSTLAKEEWDFLVGVWDLMDKKLQPRLAAHYESINGVRPEAPKAVAIQTPHGVYRGGFFPMKDDVSPTAEAHAEELTRAAEGNTAATVVRSYNRPIGKRAVRVVSLDWDSVPAHIGQVIHYLAVDNFVRDARRVLAHPTAKRAIVQRRGEAGFAVLTSFVNAVETDKPDSSLSDVARKMMAGHDWLKGTLSYASLAFNVGNALGDLMNPFVAMVKGEVSVRWTATVYLKALRNVLLRRGAWAAMRGAALKKSAELRLRLESQTDKLRKALAEVGAEGNRTTAGRYLHAAKEAAFFLQACTDALTSTVVWEARYQQALSEGATEAAAVQAADDVLRADFPTSEMALQPIFLREKAATGGLVVMMGYMVKLGNIKASMLRGPLEQLAEAEGWGEHLQAMTPLAKASLQVMLLTLMGNVIPDILAGRGWEDDEPWDEWVERKLATANAGHVPFVGFAVEWLLEAAVLKAQGSKKQPGPVSARAAPAASAMQRIFKFALKLADSDAPASERLAALLGAVNAQAGKAAGYVSAASEGEAQSGAWDVTQGLLYGPPGKHPRASPVTILRDLTK